MTDKNDKEMSNPAIEVEKLIRQFDQILSEAGVVQVNHSIAVSKKENHESVLDYLVTALENMSFVKLQQKYQQTLELVAEIVANVEEEPYFNHLKFPPLPKVGHNNTENLKEFIRYVAFIREIIQPLIDDEVGSNRRNQFLSAIYNKKKILDKGFFYEFTDGDLKRIQAIINELRDQIGESDLFEEDHRRRLLRRLEALQSEMHKKMSDVDRIWGLVGDAGIAIGKFGKDAKPFVDRIKELSQIAWKTQARAEELPSSITNPLLENDGEP
ncbi:MAG: hypothetical protein ACI832_001425 [Rheinheimera aquimaris]|jgi:hypothetical protein|uniref:hypothetical protein n=1 Tax=Rheinheimera aquimaris TaxID=412437 RepID=UPI000E8BA858|nr:hypothetical protein [Rheinheimera sp.]|tara:strand:+ start:997 stop:1806 length:810 start_codon:yes stop_codon:yes gene_type:complete